MPSAASKSTTERASQNGQLSSFPTTSHLSNGDLNLYPPRQASRRPSQSSTRNKSLSPSLTSKPSSSSMQNILQQNGSQQHSNGHWLKSQYPRDDDNAHVEFILVAAFDIDRGSIMEHQYPGPISGDESMLAELMLPDQSHRRVQDWTVFFLHKDTSADGDSESPSKTEFDQNGDRADGSLNEYDQEAEDMLEGPPLIYVLNLVNTKHDETVKRGAIVKAMAICTRHSFVDIFKPVLVLAIEEYFKSPTLETLAALYTSLNSMDLSLMPRLSLLERIILQSSNSKDMFIEKFERMIQQQKEEEEEQRLNLASDELGDEYLPPGANSKYVLPKDTHEFESRIHFNNHSIPVKIPTAKSSETIGSFSVIKLIQAFATTHATAAQPFALHPHLTTYGAYTHPIVVLVNAMLTQKRVVFLGHGKPSEEVAEAVLAACSLVSGGILRGFTRHAFPYTDLTKVDDLQKVPGFIAGVTNPVFSGNPQWWDLLCDLSTGRMKISNVIEQPQITEGWVSFQQTNPSIINLTSNGLATQSQDATGDAAFIENVMRSISNRLGEGVIRRMWREWIYKLTRIAAAFEESVYGTSALYIGGEQADEGDFGLNGHGYVWPDDTSRLRELACNVSRIEGWRGTRSYYNFKQDLIHLYNSRPIKTLDLNYHHDRLRTQKLTAAESAAVFSGFSAAIHTHAEICQLLTITSESYGGLFYLSLGLMHPRKDVRFRTVELLERVARHEAGKHYWDSLGRFAKLAFFRLRREMESAAGRADGELTKISSLSEGTPA